MRVKSILALVCGITLATTSCNDETVAPAASENPTVITALISEPENNPESRSAIDPHIYPGGHVGILWTPDDAIGVFGSSAVNAKFECLSAEATGRAQFGGNCENPQYAYYPYSPENDGASDGTLKGNLPAVQSFDTGKGILEGDYKVGTPRDGSADEFTFTHIFALLKLSVNASGTAIEGEQLKSVSIEMPDNRTLCGDFTFDLKSGAYTFTGNTSPTLKVTAENPVTLADGTSVDLYASCAPDFKTNDNITIVVTTDKHTAKFSRQVAFDFESNAVYTFNLTLSLYPDAVVEELPEEVEEETANCYMITTAGEHDFKATVIGNGQKGIIAGAGFHTDDATISPVSAKLLWEDVKGFISDVTLRDGRVYYTTTGNVGNAVIAVYDGPNATGKILWSWHIWGVGDTLPSDVEITNFNGNKYTIMSRNLGDRADKRAYGVMYQWGRKDPVSSDTIIYVNGVETTTDDPSTQRYRYINRVEAADASTATIEYSVQNPMQMTTIVNSDDWLDTENLYLWGNTYTKTEQAENETAFSDVKTIYDPSPVGYRVANCYTFTYFCKNESGSNGSSGNSRIDRINYVKYDTGYYFMANADDTEGIWFPQNGGRGGYFLNVTTYTGSGSKRVYFTSIGNTGNYWYSNPAAAASGARRALFMSMYKYVIPNSSTIANTHNSINMFDIRSRSSLNAVRCVKE